MLQTWRRPFYILKTNLMIGELILAVLGVINNFKEVAAWLYCQFTLQFSCCLLGGESWDVRKATIQDGFGRVGLQQIPTGTLRRHYGGVRGGVSG